MGFGTVFRDRVFTTPIRVPKNLELRSTGSVIGYPVSQEMADMPLESPRKRRSRAKTLVTGPSSQALPKNLADSMMLIPSLNLPEAKMQTSPKTDQNFEAVFSRLLGDKPVKRAGKNPQLNIAVLASTFLLRFQKIWAGDIDWG